MRLILALVVACGIFLRAGVVYAQSNDEIPSEQPIKIVVFGDSLVAGYNINPEEAFPVKLGARLKKDGYLVEVINAGISGDTSAGGLARVQKVIDQKPDIVILELGANDMLRGIDPKMTLQNLDRIITQVKSTGARVVIAGMRASVNMGADYRAEFDAIYESLAKKHEVTLYPFFLEGIVLKPQYNLADGLHPNPAGVDVLVGNMYPVIEQVVQELHDNI